MEIKDLINYEINDSSQTLNVTFRLIEDSDDEIRTDSIEIGEISKFGYNFLDNNEKKFRDIFNEEYDDEFDDEFGEDDFIEESIDEEELMSFLTEYYIINSRRLPDSEIF